MLKSLKKKNEGFTIIEVMIVLAIAGLILLIVFLAVPALQRNSRNTSIKNDASNVAGGVSTYESNNNGTPPTAICGTGAVIMSTGTCAARTGAQETTRVNGGTTVTTVAAAITGVGSGANQVAVGALAVWPGNTCPAAQGGSGQVSARAVAIFYATETSGAPALQCVDS